MRAIVDHRAEDFTAIAMRHHVIQDQRGVGVLPAIEQIDAVGGNVSALAGYQDRRLVTADLAANSQIEGIKSSFGSDANNAGRDVCGIRPIFHKTDMLKLGIIADREDHGIVSLIRASPSGSNETFNQCRTSAIAEL